MSRVGDAHQAKENPQFPAGNEGFSEGWPSGLEPPTSGSTIRRKQRENKGFLSSVAQKVATEMAKNGCERVRTADETDPDLARLVSVWPILPAPIRATIVTVLRSVLGEDDPAKH